MGCRTIWWLLGQLLSKNSLQTFIAWCLLVHLHTSYISSHVYTPWDMQTKHVQLAMLMAFNSMERFRAFFEGSRIKGFLGNKWNPCVCPTIWRPHAQLAKLSSRNSRKRFLLKEVVSKCLRSKWSLCVCVLPCDI